MPISFITRRRLASFVSNVFCYFFYYRWNKYVIIIDLFLAFLFAKEILIICLVMSLDNRGVTIQQTDKIQNIQRNMFSPAVIKTVIYSHMISLTAATCICCESLVGFKWIKDHNSMPLD